VQCESITLAIIVRQATEAEELVERMLDVIEGEAEAARQAKSHERFGRAERCAAKTKKL
jgi:hypothetical protein